MTSCRVPRLAVQCSLQHHNIVLKHAHMHTSAVLFIGYIYTYHTYPSQYHTTTVTGGTDSSFSLCCCIVSQSAVLSGQSECGQCGIHSTAVVSTRNTP